MNLTLIKQGMTSEVFSFTKHMTWLLQYEGENSYITTKTLIPYFDISISSRDLHQKKLVLSSSESWCNNWSSHQDTKNWVPASSDEDLVMRSKRQNKVLKFWLWYMNYLLRIVIPTKWIYFSTRDFCRLTWCHNGQDCVESRISASAAGNIITDNNGTLTIRSADKSNQGVYVLQATNSFGRVISPGITLRLAGAYVAVHSAGFSWWEAWGSD